MENVELGDEKGEEPQAIDPRDIITISGRLENCENAKKALLVRIHCLLSVHSYQCFSDVYIDVCLTGYK